MIYVITADGERREFHADKFATDEHNNLEVHGPGATVFNRTHWMEAGVDDES